MAVTVTEIRAVFKADTSGFESGVKRAQAGLGQVSRSGDEAQKATQRLAATLEHLQKQVALNGDRSREAAVKYDVLRGSLAKADVASQQLAIALARQADAQRRAQQESIQAQRSAESFRGAVVSLTGSLALMAAQGLANVTRGSFDAAVRMDSLMRGLTAVAGSAEAAQQQLARLNEVAKVPGLGFREAVEGSIRLQAAGFSARQAEEALKAFGNALATVGKGKAELDGITVALSQIQAKGKVSAEEIGQLAERLPQIRRVMIDAFGTANTEILQKAEIDSKTFIEAITRALRALPEATGGIANDLENAADSVEKSMARMSRAILPVASAILKRLAPAVEGAANAIGRNMDEQVRAGYAAQVRLQGANAGDGGGMSRKDRLAIINAELARIRDQGAYAGVVNPGPDADTQARNLVAMRGAIKRNTRADAIRAEAYGEMDRDLAAQSRIDATALAAQKEAARKAAAEAKRAAEQQARDGKRYAEEMADNIAKATLSPYQLELREMEKNVARYKAAGMSKAQIDKYVSAERQRIGAEESRRQGEIWQAEVARWNKAGEFWADARKQVMEASKKYDEETKRVIAAGVREVEQSEWYRQIEQMEEAAARTSERLTESLEDNRIALRKYLVGVDEQIVAHELLGRSYDSLTPAERERVQQLTRQAQLMERLKGVTKEQVALAAAQAGLVLSGSGSNIGNFATPPGAAPGGGNPFSDFGREYVRNSRNVSRTFLRDIFGSERDRKGLMGDIVRDLKGALVETLDSKGKELLKPLTDSLSDGLKKAVTGAVNVAQQGVFQMLAAVYNLLAVANRPKKLGIGSILGGIAGFIGGNIPGAIAGYNAGNAVDNGDLGGAAIALGTSYFGGTFPGWSPAGGGYQGIQAPAAVSGATKAVHYAMNVGVLNVNERADVDRVALESARRVQAAMLSGVPA